MRKGQAAMEFLMTYGWAILVVLIAIGALAYFGVLNPARFLPNSCTLFPGLACTEFVVDDSADRVILFMRNGIGDSMALTSLELVPGTCTGLSFRNTADPATVVPTIFTCAAGVCTSSAASLGDGSLGYLNFTCASAALGSASSRYKADIKLTYNLPSGLSHTRTGAMVAQVEP